MKNKTIRLQDVWISDTSSDPRANKVYKTVGFKADLKDSYSESEDCFFIYSENKLEVVKSYNADLKWFDSEDKALNYCKKRKLHWEDWYKKQIKEYTEMLNNSLKIK